ncbi:MAG: tetratricopeptide repeat protein, partial [Bacteroidetes bacterium]
MKKRFTLLLLVLPFVALAQPNPTIRAFQAERLFVEGRSFYDQGDFVTAIDRFNQVVELDPEHEMVYEFRGEAYYALGDYQKAIEDYAIAAQQHPQNAEIRNSLGVASANLGLFDAAYSYFYEALQIDPEHEAARENLAIADRRRQQAQKFTPPNGNN